MMIILNISFDEACLLLDVVERFNDSNPDMLSGIDLLDTEQALIDAVYDNE